VTWARYGRSLGRHREHDPHSLNFAFTATAQPGNVLWPHNAPVLDQGQLGACTGNALAQWLNTDFGLLRVKRVGVLDESDAVALYSAATKLDNIPGEFPPEDTGSSGLAVCKAGVDLGWLHGYGHAFGMDHLLATLMHSPVIVGTPWLADMFTPDGDNVIHADGDVEGGHEYLILGANHDTQQLTMLNSWSSNWGRNGRALIGFADFGALLADGGDIQVPATA
jgi:hypothetical protein